MHAGLKKEIRQPHQELSFFSENEGKRKDSQLGQGQQGLVLYSVGMTYFYFLNRHCNKQQAQQTNGEIEKSSGKHITFLFCTNQYHKYNLKKREIYTDKFYDLIEFLSINQLVIITSLPYVWVCSQYHHTNMMNHYAF